MDRGMAEIMQAGEGNPAYLCKKIEKMSGKPLHTPGKSVIVRDDYCKREESEVKNRSVSLRFFPF